MTDYKATPDQWAYQEHWAQEDGDAACILELRARVEALEAKLLNEESTPEGEIIDYYSKLAAQNAGRSCVSPGWPVMTWRLLAKALGEKASECNRESDRVALIRLLILASYLITNCFIIAGVLRHWGSEGTQDAPVRDFKRTGDSCSAHSTTMHEVDEVAIKLVGGHAGQFG